VADSDVLIVDDDQATREGLSALLRNAGFTCDAACDGPEAMQKIADGPPSFRNLDIIFEES
jgi:CheY-like chemotaxis protein